MCWPAPGMSVHSSCSVWPVASTVAVIQHDLAGITASTLLEGKLNKHDLSILIILCTSGRVVFRIYCVIAVVMKFLGDCKHIYKK